MVRCRIQRAKCGYLETLADDGISPASVQNSTSELASAPPRPIDVGKVSTEAAIENQTPGVDPRLHESGNLSCCVSNRWAKQKYEKEDVQGHEDGLEDGEEDVQDHDDD